MACALVVVGTSPLVGSGGEFLTWALVSIALITLTTAVLVIVGRRRRQADGGDSSE